VCTAFPLPPRTRGPSGAWLADACRFNSPRGEWSAASLVELMSGGLCPTLEVFPVSCEEPLVAFVGLSIGPRFCGQRSTATDVWRGVLREASTVGSGRFLIVHMGALRNPPSLAFLPLLSYPQSVITLGVMVMYRARRGFAGDPPGQGRGRHGGGTRHTGASQVEE